jgi:hypothetical protein
MNEISSGKDKKITMSNRHGVYTIEPANCGDHISDYIDQLIIPVLLAAGFQKETVEEYFADV